MFCTVDQEKQILSKLKSEENIYPFKFNKTDKNGKEFLNFIISMLEINLKKFNENIPGNKRKKTLFFFVDDQEINAFATNIYNIDVIGINIGVLTKLYDFYNHVIDDNTFPETKDDSEKRKDLIFNLQVFSILYIIFHELGHLYNGHLAFRKLNILPEIMYLITREEVLLHKTMEMDADAFAMTRSLDFIEDLIRIRELKNKDCGYDIVNYSYKSMMFAINSFYLFFQETLDNKKVSADSYFSPAIRQIYNMRIAENYIAKQRKSFVRELEKINNWLFIEGDFIKDIYFSCEKTKQDKEFYISRKIKYLNSEEVKTEMLSVDKRWNEIRDELQVNARFTLAR